MVATVIRLNRITVKPDNRQPGLRECGQKGELSAAGNSTVMLSHRLTEFRFDWIAGQPENGPAPITGAEQIDRLTVSPEIRHTGKPDDGCKDSPASGVTVIMLNQ